MASLAISSHQLWTGSSDYFYLELGEPNCYLKKEGSKREHGPTFCFDFWVRFGDHKALYHIPIVIIPALTNTSNQIAQKPFYEAK